MASIKKMSIMVGAIVLVVLYIFNMVYFSIKPDFFAIEKKTAAAPGGVFAETVAQLIENELKGTGGWMPNDIPPSPTWLLDNRPNFQLGVLETVRYSTRVLRDNLSRQRTTDNIDKDSDRAFTRFSNDPFKWIIPSAEGKFKDGARDLHQYIRGLESGSANFYPRSDNLIQLLQQYVSLLGGVNTRLLNASRKHGRLVDYRAADAKVEGNVRVTKVPWFKIDDNFYYAQGVGFALYHMLKAIRIDFAPVLKDKNAVVIVQEIIASFEEAYFEPIIITNSGKAGIFANHSNNLRVFLDDARQKSNSLIRMLEQG